MFALGQTILPPAVTYAQAATACKVASAAEPVTLVFTVTYPAGYAGPAESGVLVQRDVNGGGFLDFATLPANTRKFVDNSPVQGKIDNKYTYRAAVLNADGQSQFGPELCKTITRLKVVPPPPLMDLT